MGLEKQRNSAMSSDRQLTDEELYNAVVGFVAYQLCMKPKELSPTTRIFHDAGCDGDDGVELIEAFAKRFEVDMCGFDITRHFASEGPGFLLVWLYWLIFDRQKITANANLVRKIPITVSDLFEAAKSKRFPDLSNRPAE